MAIIEPTRAGISFWTLIPFFAIAFGLGWGIVTLLIFFPDQTETIFGPMGYTNPLFVIAVYSPGLAGIFLVWRHCGISGLSSFLRRLTLWRMPVAWWVFLVVCIPAAFYLGAAIKGPIIDPFPFSPWYAVIPALATGLVIGPVEELGWRGVALPLLQQRFAPLWSSLILGGIWGLWHLPAFFLSGSPQSAGPIWPDAQPWDTLAFAIAAVLIVMLNRRTMLTREGAVTDVLMPGK